MKHRWIARGFVLAFLCVGPMAGCGQGSGNGSQDTSVWATNGDYFSSECVDVIGYKYNVEGECGYPDQPVFVGCFPNERWQEAVGTCYLSPDGSVAVLQSYNGPPGSHLLDEGWDNYHGCWANNQRWPTLLNPCEDSDVVSTEPTE